MKVYLDTCSLQRPLDVKTQFRIRLEAEAVLSVLDLVQAGRLDLVASDVLTYEVKRNPYLARREYALETLAGAPHYVRLTRAVQQCATELNQAGIATLDSLHLASAEAETADYFCTCDDAFLKKAKREVKGTTTVVSPLELAEELDRWQSQHDH